jgi:hypothetical protein
MLHLKSIRVRFLFATVQHRMRSYSFGGFDRILPKAGQRSPKEMARLLPGYPGTPYVSDAWRRVASATVEV